MPGAKHARSLSPEARARAYERYASTDAYLASSAPQQPAARWPYFRKYFLPLMPEGKSDAVADVGCGSGDLLRFLTEHGYQNLIGIDRSPEQIEMAKRAGLGSIVSQGDAMAFLRDRTGNFECICAVDFIEHLDRSEALTFLELGRQALRPGGTLVIQTVNGASPFFGNYLYGDVTHESAYTARSLVQAMRTAGFSDLRVQSIDPVPHGLKSALRWVAWQLIKAALVACLVVETGVSRGVVVSQNLILVGRR